MIFDMFFDAHLLNKVKGLFGKKLIPSYLWLNSQLVLHWLQQHSVTLSTFVGNRVSEIQSLTSAANLRLVTTQSIPADIVSRGCTVTELDASICFTGPPFLYEGISKWPVSKNAAIDLDVVNCEKRKNIF